MAVAACFGMLVSAPNVLADGDQANPSSLKTAEDTEAAYPDLTEENKQKILELLKQAREEAMDGGSSDEKTAIFQRYKGKINNYLSKQGIHPAKKKAAKPAGDK